MKIIATKIKQKTILVLELVIGMVIMAASFILLPIKIFSIDISLLTNAFVWLVVIVGMCFFGMVGFFGFVRPYLLFKKLPDIQAEIDGEYLYIHSKKEAKIPLCEMGDAFINSTIPYVMSSEFITFLFSERYGTIIIEVPNYGKYKLYFIANARERAIELAELVQKANMRES